MRSDPSDTGGLFVGRRPGTAPTRFRKLPKRGGDLRQRFDGSIAGTLLAAMIVLSLLCWGPIPLACLWIGSQVDSCSCSERSRSCAVSMRHGSSCGARPVTISAPAYWDGCSPPPR